MVKRASDIIAPYIGSTERNIADMFREAQSKKALLLIDEADSFLQKREHAQRPWEISQVNEFLTCMEEFRGLLVCTTNLMGTMDAATLRRFDFKIRLNYLEIDQAVNLASMHLCEMNCPMSLIDVHRLRNAIAKLEVTPGDFKVLERRYRVTCSAPSVSQFLDDLTRETEFRTAEKKRPIGFTTGIDQRIRG
jgi:SpoVK/Ycf46/Vps4 family AAA+-type ATPase